MILCAVIAHRSISIKSSRSLEIKGFLAVCSPYPFIRFHTSLPLPQLPIRAKTRARKSQKLLRIELCYRLDFEAQIYPLSQL